VKKILIIFLILFPLTVHAMKMTDFTEDTSPTSDDIFWTTNAPGTSPADRKITLGNLLLWMATQDWTNSGTYTFSKVNEAGGSANALTLSGTLGIMDGADDIFRGIYLNYTNSNHTAGNVFAINIAGITGDADATESAIYIQEGWDSGILSYSPVHLKGSSDVGKLFLFDTGEADYIAIVPPADVTTTYTLTLPAAAPATSTYNRIMGCNDDGTCDWISATDKCTMSFNSDTFECINQAALYTLIQSQLFDADGDGTFEGGEEISDEQLICGNVNSGLYTLKSCGAKVTDESTASHAIYKDSDSKLQNQVLTIDAHAASTTITLIPGICPIIHNASQAAADINNTLPAVGAGKCFVALATTAQAGNYWRLTSAAVNTVCLNRTCGKDYIQFATPAVGDTFTCMSDGTNWYCYDRDSDAEVGDL